MSKLWQKVKKLFTSVSLYVKMYVVGNGIYLKFSYFFPPIFHIFWSESEIFPYSAYIAGNQGNELPFDPFEIMLESAEKNGISVHGWINPFRISTKTDIIPVKQTCIKLVQQETEIEVTPYEQCPAAAAGKLP